MESYDAGELDRAVADGWMQSGDLAETREMRVQSTKELGLA